ncbi:sulfatase-like hydrolase/transferase [uncultured Duncaniella sp.]|uniref:sulfatase-like hydrolase/transferase n=1 Tax=uncultured Duncaniella sp. TaxID=2768039 RepID=UPI00339D6A3C
MFYSLIFTTVDFIGNPYSGAAGFLNLLMQWCVVAVSASGVIGLIGINRYVFSVAFPVLMAMSAALGYFKLTMGMSLTPMCIELALVNNLNVWGTVMSVCLAMCLAVSVVASVIAVVCRWRYVADRHHAVYAAVAVLIIAGATHVARIKAPVIGRMPYVFYYSVKDYWGNRTVVRNERSTFDNTGVSVPEVSPDVVVVIGESLRSDHVPMNGYHRNTMPRLSRDSNLISFAHVFSEPWCTHTSVPRIMTRADSANPDIAYEEQSFITLFKRAFESGFQFYVCLLYA